MKVLMYLLNFDSNSIIYIMLIILFSYQILISSCNSCGTDLS